MSVVEPGSGALEGEVTTLTPDQLTTEFEAVEDDPAAGIPVLPVRRLVEGGTDRLVLIG